jgi:hypothetical protein
MPPPSFLFVTGMFRSGTTLIARMLDAHPEISFASDPYRPLFNDFRDCLAAKHALAPSLPEHAPLGSYFCDDEELKLAKIIQTSDLNVDLAPERLRRLIPVMTERAEPFSLFISRRMDRVRGASYKEVYESMMDLVQTCYGKRDAKRVGTKEVWCTEFTGPLARTFPGMKFVLMVRDPRAVFASNNVKQAKYPWFFLARQWRKLAVYSWLHSTAPEYAGSVMLVRYEDLVCEPEEMARRICDFLDVDFCEAMIDPNKFRDGSGKEWSQNSSYGTSKTISSAFTERWKTVLSEEEIRFIELLCFPEMRLFGYDCVHDEVRRVEPFDLADPPVIPEEELAEWIKPYANTDPVFNRVEMMKEYARRILLEAPVPGIAERDPRLIEALYLDPRYYCHIAEFLREKLAFR